MNTVQALMELGVAADALSPEQLHTFVDIGYLIIPGVFGAEEVDEMRTEVDRLQRIEGGYGGHEVHIEPGAMHLSNLFNKSTAFDQCLRCTPTLAAAHHVLGDIRVYSLNARNPDKGSGQQPLHSDTLRSHPKYYWMANTMVMLDDMTDEMALPNLFQDRTNWYQSMYPTSI